MLLQEDVTNINQWNRACWSGLRAPVSVLTHFVGVSVGAEPTEASITVLSQRLNVATERSPPTFN